jgi:hypothetical protein
MTTKDVIYLCLLAAVAAVFYFNGYFAGVSRSRRLIESLLDGPDGAVAGHRAPTPQAQFEFSAMAPLRPDRASGESRVIRAVFGKN